MPVCWHPLAYTFIHLWAYSQAEGKQHASPAILVHTSTSGKLQAPKLKRLSSHSVSGQPGRRGRLRAWVDVGGCGWMWVDVGWCGGWVCVGVGCVDGCGWVWVSVGGCACTWVRACVHARVRACVRAHDGVRVWLCMCVHARVRERMGMCANVGRAGARMCVIVRAHVPHGWVGWLVGWLRPALNLT